MFFNQNFVPFDQKMFLLTQEIKEKNFQKKNVPFDSRSDSYVLGDSISVLGDSISKT